MLTFEFDKSFLCLTCNQKVKPEKEPPVAPVASRPGLNKGLLLGGAAFLIVIIGAILFFANDGRSNEPTASPSASTIIAAVNTATPNPSILSVTPAPTDTPESPTDTPTPTLGIGSTRTRETDGMTLVYVPGGTFTMGSDTGLDDEKPPHLVTLDAFWLDQTEVTNAQYLRCVEAGICQASLLANGTRWNKAEYPIIGVSWQDAVNYCQWVGGRLPTEAEWEYAARGPENRIYPWGNEFDPVKVNASGQDDGFLYTAPVGYYLAGTSWVGALDLSGNVVT